MPQDNFTTVGWDGVTVDIPSKWSVVGFYSEKKGGYLRVDSPLESALEMKWSPKGKKAIDLTKTVHSFIDKLKKPLVKQNKKAQFEREVKPVKDDAIDFSWHIGEKNGRGRIAICPVCQKVVLLHLYYSKSECKAQTINRIFSSVKDHSEDGLVRYSLYGLDFKLPAGYKYKKPVLMSAYISLVFTKGFENVAVEVRNLAGSFLKDKSLEEWYRLDAAQDYKAYRLKYKPFLLGEHNACMIEGKPSGLIGLFLRLLVFWRTPANFNCLLWHNKDTNSIYTIRYLYNKDTGLLDTIKNSMIEAGN